MEGSSIKCVGLHTVEKDANVIVGQSAYCFECAVEEGEALYCMWCKVQMGVSLKNKGDCICLDCCCEKTLLKDAQKKPRVTIDLTHD
jgi:hypothetical protein